MSKKGKKNQSVPLQKNDPSVSAVARLSEQSGEAMTEAAPAETASAEVPVADTSSGEIPEGVADDAENAGTVTADDSGGVSAEEVDQTGFRDEVGGDEGYPTNDAADAADSQQLANAGDQVGESQTASEQLAEAGGSPGLEGSPELSDENASDSGSTDVGTTEVEELDAGEPEELAPPTEVHEASAAGALHEASPDAEGEESTSTGEGEGESEGESASAGEEPAEEGQADYGDQVTEETSQGTEDLTDGTSEESTAEPAGEQTADENDESSAGS